MDTSTPTDCDAIEGVPVGDGTEAQQVRQGAAWSAARSIVLRSAGQLTTIAVVHIVSPSEFGVWALALTAHSIIGNLADLGVASLLIRRDTDREHLAPSASFVSIVVSALLGALMFVSAPSVASGLGSPEAAPVMRAMSLSIVLIGLFAVPSALLTRDFRQNVIFKASLASMVVGNLSLLLLALRGAGPLSFAWSTILGQLVAGVLMVRAVGWVWPRPARTAVSALLRVGAPLSVANVVNFTYLNLDYAVVSRLKGPAVLGVYLLAFNVSSWPYAILNSAITGVSMPAFSAARDPEQLEHRVAAVVQAVALVAFPAAALLCTLAGPLVATLYGDTWSATASVLPILAPYGAMFLVTLVLGNVLVARGRSGWLLGLQIVWFAALLPTMLLLVGRFGPRGAAIAHLLIILLVSGPAYLLTVRRCAGVSPIVLGRAVRAPLALSIAAGIAAWMLSRVTSLALVNLVLGGLAGAALYGVAAAPLLLRRLGNRVPLVHGPASGLSTFTANRAAQMHLSWLYE